MNAQKSQKTFWKWQDQGYFVIIVSSIIIIKSGCLINCTLIPGLSDWEKKGLKTKVREKNSVM